MDKDKIIILALIVIIAAFLVGIVTMMPNTTNKEDTKLAFKSNATLNEGDSLQIILKDVNGTPISNQTVNVTITDEDASNSYYSVLTNDKGIGKLNLEKSSGKYDVTVSYGGNDQYNGCNATKNITIKEEVVEAQPAQNQASSQSNTHTVMGEDGYYFIVDDNGNILQNLGPSKKYYPNNPNSVDYPDAEPSGRYIDKGK